MPRATSAFKTCPQLFCDIHHWEKLFSWVNSKSSQTKTTSCVNIWGNMGQVKQGQFLGRACEGLSTALIQGSHSCRDCGLQVLTSAVELAGGRMEMSKLTSPTSTLPNEIQMVFWVFFFSCLEGTLLVCYQPLAIFQSFETVDSGKFHTVFSLALWVRQFSEVLPLLFSLTFLFLLWLLKVMSCSTNFYFGSCFPSSWKSVTEYVHQLPLFPLRSQPSVLLS